MVIENIRRLDGLDVDLGLKNCMEDEDLYLSILDMYVAQLKDNIPELEGLRNNQEWTTYGKTCHSIKGASASVGAVKIQTLSASLEAAGKDEDAGTIEQSHVDFCDVLQSTIDSISTATS